MGSVAGPTYPRDLGIHTPGSVFHGLWIRYGFLGSSYDWMSRATNWDDETSSRVETQLLRDGHPNFNDGNLIMDMI